MLGACGRWSALLSTLLGGAAGPAPVALGRRGAGPSGRVAGPGNLTGLLQAARDGDVLLLVTQEGPYVFSETLRIARALTLRPRVLGERAVFDGQDRVQVFAISADATLVDIDIVKGSAHRGGAVLVDQRSRPYFLGCRFKDNFANVEGGAMMILGASAPTLDGCTFTSNWAKFFGGGLCVDGSGTDPVLVNVAFVNNSAGINAGGLSVKGQAAPRLEACTFDDNTARAAGGALTVQEAGTAPSFTNVTFVNNFLSGPEGRGGALFCSNGAAPRFDACTFRLNLALVAGGGAFVEGSTPVFQNVTFVDNFADGPEGLAGAVFVGNGGAPVLEACSFRGNMATAFGGAVVVERKGPEPALLRGVTFYNNSAGNSGGALFFRSGADPHLESCILQDNWAEIFGGGIYVLGSGTAPVFQNVSFLTNEAGQSGGGLMLIAGAEALLQACSFRGNQAANFGGGVMLHGKGTAPTFLNVTLVDNRAKWDGGAISVNSGATPVLISCSLRGNSAVMGGGLAAEDAGSRPKLINVTIADNLARFMDGGGLLVRTGATIYLEACTLEGNRAKRSGGGLKVGGSAEAANPSIIIRRARLINVTFVGNSAGGNGGALFVDSGAVPRIEACTLRGNLAEGSGGGLSVQGKRTEPELIGVEFVGNSAGKNGGAILVGSGNTLRLGEGVMLQGNIAKWAGGGVCFEDGGTATDLRGSPRPRLSLLGNVAIFGGGAFVPLCSSALWDLLCEGRIAGNSAKVAGGGVYLRLDPRHRFSRAAAGCPGELRAAPDGNEAPRGPGIASSAVRVRLLSASEAPVARFAISAKLVDTFGDVVVEEDQAIARFSSELVRWDKTAAARVLAAMPPKERAMADLVDRTCIAKAADALTCVAVRGGMATSFLAAFLPPAPVNASFPFEMKVDWTDPLTGELSKSTSVVGHGVVTVTADCPANASILPDEDAWQRGENFSCPWVSCPRGHFFSPDFSDSTSTDPNERTGECTLCRDVYGADCSATSWAVGLRNLRLRQHHWRPNLTTLHIMDCRASREDEWSPCEGGSGAEPDGYCRRGHAGPKCRMCLESPRHYRSGRDCLPCVPGGRAERAAIAVLAVCLLGASAAALRKARSRIFKRAELPSEHGVAKRMAVISVAAAYRAYQFIGLLGRLQSKSSVPTRLQPLTILLVDFGAVHSMLQSDCLLGFEASQRALLAMNLVTPALAVLTACGLIWVLARQDPYRCKYFMAMVVPPIVKVSLVGVCLAVSNMLTCDSDFGEGEGGPRLTRLPSIRCEHKEGIVCGLLGVTFMLFYGGCLIVAPRLAMDRFKALTRGLRDVLVTVSVASPSGTAGALHIQLQGSGDPIAIEAALDARMVWLLAVIKVELIKNKVDVVSSCVSWTESPGARRVAVMHPDKLILQRLVDALTAESPDGPNEPATVGSCPDEGTQRYLTKNCVAARWKGDRIHPLLAGLSIVTQQTFWQADVSNALFGLTLAYLPSLGGAAGAGHQAAVGAAGAAGMLLFQLTHPITNPRRQWDALVTFAALLAAFCIMVLVSVRGSFLFAGLALSLCLLSPLAWSCLTLATALVPRLRDRDMAFRLEHELAFLRYWRTMPEERAMMRTRVAVDCIQAASPDAAVVNLRAAWHASPPDPARTSCGPLVTCLRRLAFHLGSRKHCSGWRCACPDKVPLEAGLAVAVLRRSAPLYEVRVEGGGGVVTGWVHEGALEAVKARPRAAKASPRLAPPRLTPPPGAQGAGLEVELVDRAARPSAGAGLEGPDQQGATGAA